MDNSAKSKSELLSQLKIDRSVQPENTSMSLKAGISIALISALLGAVISYFIFEPSPDISHNSSSVAQATVNKSSQPTVQANLLEKTSENDSKAAESESILNASGYITARRTATVSAEIMGLINSVNVEEGMAVKQGDVLAQLDDTIAKVSVNLAQAQIEAAKARLLGVQASQAESIRQHQRVFNNQFSSDAEKSRAQTELETSAANIASSNAELKVAQFEAQRQQERLDDHTIRAPFSGVVTIKNAQPGEIVSPGSAGGGFTRTGICTIVDMDSLEIEVDVNESFIGRVYAGQQVEAQLDAYSDWTIPASVIAIIPAADRAKATVKVRIKIEVNDNKILPDMGVKVAFLK